MTTDLPELPARVVARCSPTGVLTLPHGGLMRVSCDPAGAWTSRRVHLSWKTPDAPTAQRSADLLLVSRPQPFGGRRWWWACPRCRQCRGGLFLSAGWACRTCYRLTYASRREDTWHRAERRLRTLALRLGVPRDELRDWTGQQCPEKPPRMRWATYDRIADEWETVWQRGNAAGWQMLAGLMKQ
jgi:hypothetical protein